MRADERTFPIVKDDPNSGISCVKTFVEDEMARREIVSTPGYCFGEWRFDGTRVPVFAILGRWDAGDTLETLVDDYPSLTAEDILYAVEHRAEYESGVEEEAGP